MPWGKLWAAEMNLLPYWARVQVLRDRLADLLLHNAAYTVGFSARRSAPFWSSVRLFWPLPPTSDFARVAPAALARRRG